MKILGIDYGTKRVGIAISDEGNQLAFPKGIVVNDLKLFENIGTILQEEQISEIIIGESVNSSGEPNRIAHDIELFISKLKEKFQLPIHTEKEFLTSLHARGGNMAKHSLHAPQSHSRQKDSGKGHVDASAAALILQRYLDRRNLRSEP